MLLRSWAAVSHSARYPGLLTDCCSATFIPQTDVHFGLEFLLQQQQQQQVQQNNNNDASGQLCHDVMTILPLLMCMWPSYSQNKGFILLYIVCLQPARRQENKLKYKFLFCKWENRRVQHWQHLTNSSIYTPIYARVCVCVTGHSCKSGTCKHSITQLIKSSINKYSNHKSHNWHLWQVKDLLCFTPKQTTRVQRFVLMWFWKQN